MEDWEELRPAVAGFSRAVTMDMPGYGRAEHPRGFEYTVPGYAAYLGQLLDQLTVRRANLVMHDFGGLWGLKWALGHPDRVGSLTLINCSVMESYTWHGFARIWQTPILGELAQLTATKWGMRVALNRTNPKPLPQRFFDRVMRYADWGHKQAVLKLYRASRHTGRAVPDMGALRSIPMCVIWGWRPVHPGGVRREAEEVLPGRGGARASGVGTLAVGGVPGAAGHVVGARSSKVHLPRHPVPGEFPSRPACPGAHHA